MKKKKILIGSIFAAFLLASIPFISAAQEQKADETFSIPTTGNTMTSGGLMTLDELIVNLQYVHDYIAENYPEEFDQEFLAEFQENINALSNTGSLWNPVICASLFAIVVSLVAISDSADPELLGLVLLLIFTVVVIAAVLGCLWATPPVSSASGTSSCGCTQQNQQTSQPISQL